LCAAESLRLFANSRTAVIKRPGVLGLILLLSAIVIGWFFGANGEHAFPFVWIALGIGALWAFLEVVPAPNIQTWSPAIVTFTSLLAAYLCIAPNCGVPKFNLSQQLTQPTPLDPQRLYLSVYLAPEDFYRAEKKSEPFGATLRVGSTSMWAGVPLINGYSPIRPSGVAREFAFAIHGEIRPDIGNNLLEHESGPNGNLARLGVDGIILAKEIPLDPKPDNDWELAVTTNEGRVFHRRAGPLPRVRSVTAIDSRPNEQFVAAEISGIINSRNGVQVELAVPAGGKPALLTISRPFFNGYRAEVGDRFLKVNSYRGLIPTIDVPAGVNGRLRMVYRPWWLLWGGAIAGLSLLAMTAGFIGAGVSRPRRDFNPS
jgi:hypothetical protein